MLGQSRLQLLEKQLREIEGTAGAHRSVSCGTHVLPVGRGLGGGTGTGELGHTETPGTHKGTKMDRSSPGAAQLCPPVVKGVHNQKLNPGQHSSALLWSRVNITGC